MRRLAAILAGAAAALGALAPAASAGTSLTASGVPTFPQRSWILTLPSGVSVAPGDVRVTEDGAAVRDLRVAPVDGTAGRGFGVVLVVDSSESMAGSAIDDAMTAARTFAGQRSTGQRLGVVTFDNDAKVVLRPTTDAQRIDAALAEQPALRGGTHLFDAAATGVELVRRSGVPAGAVIVLSDGSDRGSAASAQSVAAAAARAHVRIFTIGLKSTRFEDATLKALAGAASGEYLGAASGAELVRVYRDLGGRLANAYLVSYRSTQPVGSTVGVRATAHGQTATAAYRAPSLATVAEAREADRKAHESSFLGSAPGIVLATLITLLAVFFLMWTLFAARRGDRGVRDRVRDYGSTFVQPEPLEPVAEPVASRSVAQAWKAGLAEQLEFARMGLSPAQFVALACVAGIAVTWASVALVGSVIVAPVAIAATWWGARGVLRHRVERQRTLFADQLADTLHGVASAMRTGHSFAGALSVVAEEAPEPTATELGRVIADERIGVPLDEALNETVRRTDNRDLEQVALVAVLQRETGGNGAEALDRVVENLRGRDEVRRLVKGLTAQGQLTRWILTALPIVLLVGISFISPDYMDPLLHTSTGHALLLLATVLVATGSIAIKRLVEIKV